MLRLLLVSRAPTPQGALALCAAFLIQGAKPAAFIGTLDRLDASAHLCVVASGAGFLSLIALFLSALGPIALSLPVIAAVDGTVIAVSALGYTLLRRLDA